MRLRRLLPAGAALLLTPLAGITLVRSQSVEHPPDPGRGAVIAAQGVGSGAPPCAQCHAFNGASDSSGAFPRIAGQSAYYLAKQLHDFSSGVRSNAFMSPIAKSLSTDDDDIADVAAYYAGLDAPFLPLKSAAPEVTKRGEELATIGSAERQVQSCNNCHGPGGIGESPAIPYLAGQYAPYIAFELKMWQRGFRKNSADSMGVIAKKLDDQEIAAVAAYYQQVRSSLEAPMPQVNN